MGNDTVQTQVTVGDVRKQEADVLYGLVLLFTFGQLILIVWDMFSMLPGFADLVKPLGLTDPGRVHSIGEITSMYLALTGIYIGRNAWRKYTGKDDSEAVPSYVFLKIRRGYFYVSLWGTLCFVAYMLKAATVISRMPYELTITTFGVIGALFGDKAINSFVQKRTVGQLEKADAQSTAADSHSVVMAHIEQAGRITNAECQQVTGLKDAQATNVLQALEREGKLEQVGQGRYAYYRKKGSAA